MRVDDLNATNDAAMLGLLAALRSAGYAFVTPTSATIAWVRRRRSFRPYRDLHDAFGWSLSFRRDDMPPAVFEAGLRADILIRRGDRWLSRLRVSSLEGRFFLHDRFPANAPDAVFFGPDTYRFAGFLRRALDGVERIDRLVDIGAGTGAGAIIAAGGRMMGETILTDINPRALGLARINAADAGAPVALLHTDGLDGVAGPVDAVVANPPFLALGGSRRYREGGGAAAPLGGALSLAWARAAAALLAPGGRLILYTASAIVDGQDHLYPALSDIMAEAGCTLRYEEIDPDIFGAVLRHPRYWGVDRLAAIGAVAVKRS